jgi:trigger factor
MEVTETTSDGLKRELKVVVEADELNQRLSERLHELKSRVRLKGFRPGKVPVEHLRKIYGRSVMAEIIQQTVNETSQKAVTDREERPAVSYPTFEQVQDALDDLVLARTTEIADHPRVDVGERQVREALDQLIEKDIVRSAPDGRKRYYWLVSHEVFIPEDRRNDLGIEDPLT